MKNFNYSCLQINRGQNCFFLALFFILFLFTQNLNGQGCKNFAFEVKSVVPSSPMAYFPQSTKPGGMEMYYEVYLKVTSGQMPSSYNFNFLHFESTVNTNKFTKNINRHYTEQISNALYGGSNPYLQYLKFAQIDNGIIEWVVGDPNSTCPVGGIGTMPPFVTLSFSGTSSVHLFTIVVDAMYDDQVQMTSATGSIIDCVCGETITNVPVTPPLNVTMQTPTVCPALGTVEVGPNAVLSTTGLFYSIPVIWKNPMGNLFEIDGVINVVPVMNGISALVLAPEDLDPTGLTFEFSPVVPNSTGGYDIYFHGSMPPPMTAWTPSSTTINQLFTIRIGGLFNLSAGADFVVTLVSGRCGRANNSVCRIPTTTTICTLPGADLCDDDLAISAKSTSTSDCGTNVQYTISHNSLQSLSFDRFRMELVFEPSENTSTIGSAVSALPCPNGGCWSGPTYNPVTEQWRITYIYDIVSQVVPLILPKNTTIDVPIIQPTGSTELFIPYAEGRLTGNTDLCALEVGFMDNPVFSSKTTVKFLDQDIFSPTLDFAVDYAKATITSGVDPTYKPSVSGSCYILHLCPDPAKSPFTLTATNVTPNYGLGVSTYDLVLIAKHLQGVLPFSSIHQGIAADVNFNFSVDKNDGLTLRNFILGNISVFPCNLNSMSPCSFCYIEDGFQFPTFLPNPSNNHSIGDQHWMANKIHFNNTTPNKKFLFHTIKIGDLNNQFSCGAEPMFKQDEKTVDRATSEQKTLNASFILDQSLAGVSPNQDVYLPISLSSNADLEAFQGCLSFDPNVFQFIAIYPNENLPAISDNCFGLNGVSDGKIRFSAIYLDGDQLFPANGLLFTVHLRTKHPNLNVLGSQILFFDNAVLPNETYDEMGNTVPMDLNFVPTSETERRATKNNLQMLTIKAAPNPFLQADGMIFIESRIEGPFEISILGQQGQILDYQVESLKMGTNIFKLKTKSELPAGVYFVEAKCMGNTTQCKIVKN